MIRNYCVTTQASCAVNAYNFRWDGQCGSTNQVILNKLSHHLVIHIVHTVQQESRDCETAVPQHDWPLARDWMWMLRIHLLCVTQRHSMPHCLLFGRCDSSGHCHSPHHPTVAQGGGSQQERPHILSELPAEKYHRLSSGWVVPEFLDSWLPVYHRCRGALECEGLWRAGCVCGQAEEITDWDKCEAGRAADNMRERWNKSSEMNSGSVYLSAVTRRKLKCWIMIVFYCYHSCSYSM